MGPKSHSQRMVTLQAHVYAVDAIGAHVCRHTCWANSKCTWKQAHTQALNVTGIALCLRLQGAGASAPSRWTLGRVPGHVPYSPLTRKTQPDLVERGTGGVGWGRRVNKSFNNFRSQMF